MATVYCTPADLIATGINPFALQDVLDYQQTAACLTASELADSYLRGRYALPLSQWGYDLRFRTAQVAVYIVLKTRGRNPEAGADEQWRLDYEDAIHWFEGIQRQNTHPDVTPAVQPGQDPTHDLPQVLSQAPRQWGTFSGNGTPSCW